jgi:hypothetical protein
MPSSALCSAASQTPIAQFCRAAESCLDTEFLGFPPSKKFKKGEIRALFSVGDFPSEANSSVAEGHCQSSRLAALIAAQAPAT